VQCLDTDVARSAGPVGQRGAERVGMIDSMLTGAALIADNECIAAKGVTAQLLNSAQTKSARCGAASTTKPHVHAMTASGMYHVAHTGKQLLALQLLSGCCWSSSPLKPSHAAAGRRRLHDALCWGQSASWHCLLQYLHACQVRCIQD
jgi:hypothetical protein